MKQVLQKKLISDYRHTPGRNCITSTWSGVLNYKGYKISQTDFFGYGCGMMFLYQAFPKTKEFNMIIVSDSIEENFLTNTGFHGTALTFNNDDSALEEIFKCLDNGLPVMANINPQFAVNLATNTENELLEHIECHWVVVVGYDLERDVLTMFDSAKLRQVEIKISDFKKGRNSGNFLQNPQNFFYSISYPDEMFPPEISMLLSLRKTTYKFLKVQKYNHASLFCGKYGYEKAIRHIALFNKMMDKKKLQFTLMMLKATITTAGSAKGAFRFTFAEYLTQCHHVLKLDGLVVVSDIFKESGNLWKNLVNILDMVANDIDNPKYWGKNSLLVQALIEIYNKELDGFNLLDQLLNRNYGKII